MSINALGFAGSFLVRDRAELQRLYAHGPMSALREVALPRHHPSR
jgi:ATP adenylyltransferase